MSSFSALGDVARELAMLERDLSNGSWRACHANLLEAEDRDCGYRLIASA